jgi:hypothetical protein
MFFTELFTKLSLFKENAKKKLGEFTFGVLWGNFREF